MTRLHILCKININKILQWLKMVKKYISYSPFKSVYNQHNSVSKFEKKILYRNNLFQS